MNPDNREQILSGLRRLFDEALSVAGLLIPASNDPSRGSDAVAGGDCQLESEGTGESMLTVKEAGKLLRVSERTIYEWDSQGKIPTRRVNGELRFLRNELLGWTKQGKSETRKEQKQVRPSRLHVAK